MELKIFFETYIGPLLLMALGAVMFFKTRSFTNFQMKAVLKNYNMQKDVPFYGKRYKRNFEKYNPRFYYWFNKTLGFLLFASMVYYYIMLITSLFN